jgi:hypothetical protein
VGPVYVIPPHCPYCATVPVVLGAALELVFVVDVTVVVVDFVVELNVVYVLVVDGGTV